MTPKEKANQLVEKYKDYVHGYVGSSMLTNHEYPEQILSQAKKAATIAVDEIFNVYKKLSEDDDIMFPNEINYWEAVKAEIEGLVV